MIPVTKTYFPDIAEYQKNIERIWENQWLTNRGELTLELEEMLRNYLGVKNIIITTNGTLPLQIALRNVATEGEVITTPFSYVATTAAIVWEKFTPVFVDVHPDYLTIDESKIEEAITSKTTAILATHVFGNPCEVEEISRIAKKYRLKVIYDAAHCFGVNFNNESIFNFGDISTCSFHATKIFHTGEGGAIFCSDQELHDKLYYTHNFGHNGPLDFHGLGINAKISELQAAMGLCVLPQMNEILKERRKVTEVYDQALNFKNFRKIKIRRNTEWNYSYYPIIFEEEKELLDKQSKLNKQGIYPRRYFYPSLNTLNYVKPIKMPVSETISSRILCLPLYVGLKDEDLSIITEILNS
ncbi:DegT/DnrJ/EryC1/StrS family aminotransferase [Salinimicrobium sp. CDJ15-81-2]|nr:DegT/DnrJ/EryC1/StrS family aminotransferase [Salinimicrobium nanhaiense]